MQQSTKNLSSTRLKRRDFLKLAGTSILATSLAACEIPSFNAPSTAGEKIQLVYQDWRTTWFPAMAQEMLQQFHAEHPEIEVFYTLDPPSETFNEKMMADFAAGTAADVFQGCCDFFPTWAQKGYTLDLRPYVKDLDAEIIADWDPAQYQALFRADGLQYGLPKYHGALALYYNKDLFDLFKVDYPADDWTHDDYRSAMQLLTRKQSGSDLPAQWGSMLNISWDRIQVHVNGWGGHFVSPGATAGCAMDEPEALEAMEWLRACMWDDKIMATPLDVQNISLQDAFLSGKVAMIEDGSWALKTILSAAKFRVGAATFPAGPQKKVTLATTDGFGIFAGTKHPEAAWELLKFLIGKDYGRAMAKANLLQPARASLVDEWAQLVKDQYPEQAQEIDPLVFAAGHLKGYSVVAEVFPNQADAQKPVYQAWDQIYVMGQAPVDSLKPICRQIETDLP